MREAFLKYWQGILLTLVGALATLGLASSGQLGLYIHPRYFVFTAAMASIAIVVVVIALVLPRQRDDGHEHEHEHESGAALGRDRRRLARGSRWRGRFAVAGAVVILLATTGALIALPPATLSTSLADGRDLGSDGILGENAIQLAQADPSTFTVKDWAVLIGDGASSGVLQSARPEIVGFVIADPESPERSFAVARYVMTCCAVDAQPVGVRIELPGWQAQFADGAWVEVGGRFVEQDGTWVLRADTAVVIDEPAEPYVY